MEKWKKIRMLERLAIIAGVGLITAGGLWGLSKIEPDKKYLRGKDFENAEWIMVENDSDNIREYFERENIPHGDVNYYLYENKTKEYNGNRKSLKGWILLPDLDKDGRVSRYLIPYPREVNTGN